MLSYLLDHRWVLNEESEYIEDKAFSSRRLNLCGLVVKFLTTDTVAQVRFPALPDFLRSSGSGTGSTQPRGHN
jgi:hypothetical protein